jgi:hypothetical protein
MSGFRINLQSAVPKGEFLEPRLAGARLHPLRCHRGWSRRFPQLFTNWSLEGERRGVTQ